ncbi:hypothetical protein S40285_07079 [Stachybotrys chlorohalonatus IBT 40285]|uniref:Alpha/beta hydrolase fold-3 domain-containing protein n=1 Tax=Stachybotrys chlorohalonatus (strain IBT 40285) TaxID=1283841 RepID=A0A084QD24_STAC4|nr:hypothetical protein S40285_07079 [Stachybotrys chlorohalonata IBT 40285]
MIDHVLGRPSAKSRRLQVLAVLSFWGFYLYRGGKHGPPGVERLSRLFTRRLTTWQTVVLTMMYLYAARNFSALVGLAGPEPLANMYDTTFFRATWVLTALDAGFWTAMKIRTKWLRDIASIAFTLFYLVAAEKADEKVRKVRGMLTVEHMRVGWDKGKTPYLSFLQGLMRPRFTRWPPRQVRIARPANSDYKEPVLAWLYYDGPLADLEHHHRLILDIPGGGFVAMDPRCNDDRLFAWAAKSGLPILSLDYKKAPEFPYPYALNECFDVYATLVMTRGRCIGMSGKQVPRVILTGDSAGGNLAVAATLMILETTAFHFRRFAGRVELPPPDGLVLFYPALDMNIGNWMSDEQMSLIQDRQTRNVNRSIMRRKSREYNDLVGTPHHTEDEDDGSSGTPREEGPVVQGQVQPRMESAQSPRSPHPEFSRGGPPSLEQVQADKRKRSNSMSYRPEPLKTRLATSSMISYFNDRVLTPEMMRAMIILYIGPHNRPDFSQDYLLSPVLAPDTLLAKFPKTYFLTGERDPLVDDTVVFAGRLRRAKEAAALQNSSETDTEKRGTKSEEHDESDAAEVMLLPGISHGFLQFPAIYPPAWKHFERCAKWFDQIFTHAEKERRKRDKGPPPRLWSKGVNSQGRHHARAESSGDEDKFLEMSMTKAGRNRGASHSKKEADGKAAASPETHGEDANQRAAGKKVKKSLTKNKSLVKLKSSDDLLGRRMHGLASGLTATADDD